jgi:hypothetical protein
MSGQTGVHTYYTTKRQGFNHPIGENLGELEKFQKNIKKSAIHLAGAWH